MIKKIDAKRLDKLQQAALKSPRKRSNYNLHPEVTDPVNRLCITLSKGTYIQPHRHLDKWELILAISGKIGVLIYSEHGTVIDKFAIAPDSALCAFEMIPNTWHSLYPITDIATFFEVKLGPFVPTPETDFASWAPKESDANTEDFLNWSLTATIGSSFTQEL